MLGWFPIMKEKDSFGSISSENLSIGDIVEWSSWSEEHHDWEYNYGIITEIKNEIRSNRLVSISNVTPLQGNRGEIEHFSLSLRLVSKTGGDNKNVNS